jgi:glycosyltransferase involved in cell wall biosynthesis
MLTDSRPHGDGLAAHGLICALARRGHRLHVAVPGTMDLRRPLPDGVVLHRLLRSDVRWGPAAAAAFMLRLRALAARLADRVDVVHQLNPVNTGLSLALPGGGPPLVLGPFVGEWPAQRDGPRAVLKRAVKRPLLLAQERRADLLLLSSPAAASKLADPSGVRDKTRVLSYGIDLQRFAATPPPDARTILFLGRLEPIKGVFTLLDAYERVAAELPDVSLRLAGAGAAEETVRARIARLAGAELVGPVAREDVPAALAGGAVYCIPSFGEPFGLGALEAMACGRPVVGTAAGGLAHLVPEQGGRLVPPGDAAALAAALRELLLDPALRERMGGHNRREVERSYGWDRVAARLEGLYDEVIGPEAARYPR